MQPDWTWFKKRDTTNSNHWLFDTTRGMTKRLRADDTNQEDTINNITITSTGVDVGTNYLNEGTANYVVWAWKANGGTTSSNTDGSVTSTVQANTEAGFSIVNATNIPVDANAHTIGHGLGIKPKMFILKNRDLTDSWYVYNENVGADRFLTLDSSNGESSSATPSAWHNDEPTTDVLTIKGNSFVTSTSQNLIFYVFAEVEGYSKFGSYTGNNSTDGTFVYTGFRPAFVITKKSNGTSNWNIIDNHRPNEFNPANNGLLANSALTESTLGTSHPTDLLSNGFKFRNTEGGFNASATYIYMAFAEMPTKYANAR
jgi:hypothetical protein